MRWEIKTLPMASTRRLNRPLAFMAVFVFLYCAAVTPVPAAVEPPQLDTITFFYGDRLPVPAWYLEEALYAKTEEELFEKVLQRARDGDVFAQIVATLKYVGDGEDDPAQYKNAAEWVIKASEQEHPVGHYLLGEFYYFGHGVEKDVDASIAYTRAAADAALPIAQVTLSQLYHYGQRGVGKDVETARELLFAAVNANFHVAQYRLGMRYYRGRGFEVDDDKAFHWFKKAADQGHLAAINSVGLMYLRGHSVQRDYRKAASWFEKAAAYGQSAALYNLGSLYERGWGVSRDLIRALEFYELAAAQKYPRAVQAAFRLRSSKELKAKEQELDGRTAADTKETLERAARNGDDSAFVQLGKLYENGALGDGDDVEAYKWYSLAAAAGNDRGRVNRDFVGTRMTPEQVAAAEKRVADWSASR